MIESARAGPAAAALSGVVPPAATAAPFTVGVIAVIAAIVIATVFAVGLNSIQKSADMEFKTEGVRL
jgi:hypothetical protein